MKTSMGDFLDCLDSSALILDTDDSIVKINKKLQEENKVFKFFHLKNDSYQLNQIEKEDWYKYLSICGTTGSAKFLIKSCFYECVMNRLSIEGNKLIMVQFFENRSLKEDVAEYFLNDFRLSQLKELGEIAAGIAHEINNPLTVVSARVQMLLQALKEKKTIPADVLEKNLDKVYTQAERIKKIVDGMRVFSRNSNYDERVLYNLKSIVEEAFSLVSGGMRDNGIEFRFNLQSNEKYISCKPTELIQVFVNLFNNSIYALSKTTFPTIDVHFVEDSQNYHIYFKDNGPGVPEDFDTKIFAPFFTTKPVGAGTGLGLSISNRIIQSYGGSLSLDRTHGNSCFYIKLPRAYPQDFPADGATDIYKYSS
ncbi:sensor histidine kinase [Pseudobdellovibrio exovorus]|uniref:histidine kinase n=1 Tax=Pseudobdellovibrio exovorus JSS TaxID=1184267 RepID=M4VS50_9BACT|nr:HAMP domain-containing sensor histidine kinase [Pseudobdellovibrio exovorus]AGH96009.1 hypothetical protein A11Q_1793 [Pseudobdellovibrio exovorus JSS]